MHSGWTARNFHGYTINIPAGTENRTESRQVLTTTAYELIGRRSETGSQYSIAVGAMPSVNGKIISLDELARKMQQRMTEQRSVTRAGIVGVAGKIVSRNGTVTTSETEMFLHNGNLVVLTYSPYSEIKDEVGGQHAPHKNERELDRPEEFFSSFGLP